MHIVTAGVLENDFMYRSYRIKRSQKYKNKIAKSEKRQAKREPYFQLKLSKTLNSASATQ